MKDKTLKLYCMITLELVDLFTKKTLNNNLNPEETLELMTNILGEFNKHILVSLIKSCIQEDKKYLFIDDFLSSVKSAVIQTIDGDNK